MLLNLFKRFNANSIYNFMPRLLLFALFFLNSSLPSILYSQLGKQCICTHKMHFQLVGTISQSPETVKINFHGATPIGFVILMYFQHFINFSPLPSRFMKLFSQIFYADSVYPRCRKNFVFINFSNIRDKTGKVFLFISWQYHGNLSVSLKTRKILCIQNLPYQKD